MATLANTSNSNINAAASLSSRRGKSAKQREKTANPTTDIEKT